VNDETHIGASALHRGKNLVERNDDCLARTERELKREVRTRHFPGTAMCRARNQSRTSPKRGFSLRPGAVTRHEHRSVAIAHARAAGQQRILVEHVCISVDADRRDVQLAARGALVERLDILQDVLEFPAARVDLVLRQRVEHESVVRVGEWPA
jgi:hypothetical protein